MSDKQVKFQSSKSNSKWTLGFEFRIKSCLGFQCIFESQDDSLQLLQDVASLESHFINSYHQRQSFQFHDNYFSS